ncbi:helix-turn-helix domain-containing protein [Natrialbaceae archaeon AArc-T1-2]|uniref:helix-turn-helix domain-containing protein n=1 Tax=Natrialbaceae archaeon AArc-T1-2 TaxID=3053904 RepID=UPI00255A9D7D|nr:helix-turn-helix domain-containing protein [Natrialbaceae archaeon AArc-T1-2]WIV66828.1 helix-turn-helix domain-containing protein [Natrialbaceae archaeon AArc-T1-2]
MTTVTEITVSAANVALEETFDALSGLEIRVESVVGEQSSQAMPLVWVGGVDRDDLEDTLASDPSVDAFMHLLADEEGTFLYRLEYADAVADRCRVIFDHGGTILDAHGSTGRWTLRLLFPDRDSLSDAIGEFEDRGVRIDVKRMVEAGRDADLEVTAALTEAQEEAITEAYRHGYYDVPRRISLEDLAAELDISHQALSERLRRANKVLASEQVDESTAEAVSD